MNCRKKVCAAKNHRLLIPLFLEVTESFIALNRFVEERHLDILDKHYQLSSDREFPFIKRYVEERGNIHIPLECLSELFSYMCIFEPIFVPEFVKLPSQIPKGEFYPLGANDGADIFKLLCEKSRDSPTRCVEEI